MKIKRAKKAERILNFYRHNFGHRPPFQILIDGTFCHACLEVCTHCLLRLCQCVTCPPFQMKVNIRDRLPKYLGEVKLLTTSCCIQEAETLMKMDSKLYGVSVILKQFAIHKCNCKESKPAAKCIKGMLGSANSSRYFVASQDKVLRGKCHRIPGTPVLYLHRSAPTLEKPSQMSSKEASNAVNERMRSAYQVQKLEAIKKEEFGEENVIQKKKRRRKGKNPLSCLKSKKMKGPAVQPKKDEKERKKRKRVRKRGKDKVNASPPV